ncbi:protein of unknown function [Nannocystis exedens]|uniref:DUF4180 domain-containing protein n=1 Tax=Nannocystis exedens TaxID=54 RepID=A0A1I2HP99_9BACT|nr:DUF4180 domain-containing protein [Nannocystis exedens]PCC69369.1 alpha/beta hydrolase [Nannocystis exedens]SFF31348.1 protein of unknown function [Nannocystis exedens]
MTAPQLRQIGATQILVLPDTGPSIGTVDDAIQLIGDASGSGADTVVIPVARLHSDFLVLRTRMAGEFTQKFVIYQRRLVLLGDLSLALIDSDALRDYVREANRGDSVWFFADWPELERRLAGDPG